MLKGQHGGQFPPPTGERISPVTGRSESKIRSLARGANTRAENVRMDYGAHDIPQNSPYRAKLDKHLATRDSHYDDLAAAEDL